MKKKKQRGENKNVPSKYAAQTEKIHKTVTGAELEWWHKWTRKKRAKVQKQKWLKKWGSEGFQSQKLENGGKPKGHEVNTSNHHAPGGHVACSAATMHLIWSETPRVMDSSRKPFISYYHIFFASVISYDAPT